jgi:hypothetical protein
MSETTPEELPPERTAIVLDLGGARAGWTQRLADLELWSERPLLPDARPAPRPDAGSSSIDTDPGALVYDGPGSVTGRLERVRAWRSRGGVRTVEFERGERFRVAPSGERIEATPARTPDEPRTLELALGAPLALALAIRGVHLLHASAIVAGGAVVALTGASGAGKSTLAAAAARSERWRRAADDILPVRLDRAPTAMPAFPQLKLRPEQAWPAEAPPALPLTALVEIAHRERGGPPRLEPYHGADAVSALVAATVAARLFDETLLASHLERTGRSAGSCWIGRLRFASGERGLAEALRALEPFASRPEARGAAFS